MSEVIITTEDHSPTLKRIKRLVETSLSEYEVIKNQGSDIDKVKRFNEYYDFQLRALDIVGKLSLIPRGMYYNMKDQYDKTYANSPAMAKQLFSKHYYGMLKPYDELKDIIWKNIMILDKHLRKMNQLRNS